MFPSRLTLNNLVPSDQDKVFLKSLSKPQRLALYNLCEIFRLTFYQKEDRAAAERLRELIRKNTLSNANKCEFDMSLKDKTIEEFNKRLHK